MSRLYFIIFILTLFSCSKETVTNEPYFKFDNVGELLLSEVKLNDTIKFAGSNGSNRVYKVFKIEKTKETLQDCSWNFGTCVTYYHFDLMRIYYIRTDSIPTPPNSPLTYSLTLQMQLPKDVDKKNIPKNVQARASLFGNAFIDFNAIPTSSNVWNSPYISYPDFYNPLTLTTYSNSTRTYTDIVIIKSGNNSVYVDPLYGTNYTVNEVWFDKKYGFVFFKDVFGNIWSRTN